MKTKILVPLIALAFLSGCASPSSQYGKKKMNLLGGLVKYEEGAYTKAGPLTIGEKASTFNPNSNLDGDIVSLFWGLITYVDE